MGASSSSSPSCESSPWRTRYVTKENLSELYAVLKPGDILKFPRGSFSHYAIYIGKFKGIEHCIIELNSTERNAVLDSMVGSVRKKSRCVCGVKPSNKSEKRKGKIEFLSVEEALENKNGGSVAVHNKLDKKIVPLPNAVEKAKEAYWDQPNYLTDYNVFGNNCEHFANTMRYGVPYSTQANTVKDVGKSFGVVATATLIIAGGVLIGLFQK